MSSRDFLQKSADNETQQLWKEPVKNGVKKVEDLCGQPLSAIELNDARVVSRHHKGRIPRGCLGLIDWNDEHDPIKKQVIPSTEELNFNKVELQNPIGDDAFSPVASLTHFNHLREITVEAEIACRRLREAGMMLLNQTTLLKGVNDDIDTLVSFVRNSCIGMASNPVICIIAIWCVV